MPKQVSARKIEAESNGQTDLAQNGSSKGGATVLPFPQKSAVKYSAPPGNWELDQTHRQTPLSIYAATLFEKWVVEGFRASFKHYGVPMDTLEVITNADTHYFAYMCPRPIGAPKESKGAPPKFIFKLLFALHPELRRRKERIKQVFAEKTWLKDLKYWNEEVKPELLRNHQKLNQVNLSELTAQERVKHLTACRENMANSYFQHHRFNVPAILPVGRFVMAAADWTGVQPGEILECLRGFSSATRGPGEKPLAGFLQKSLENKKASRLILEGDLAHPSEILEELRREGGEASLLLDEYLLLAGPTLITGDDIVYPTLSERPELVLKALRERLKGLRETSQESRTHAAEDKLQSIRNLVPASSRAAFDELFEDAKLLYPIRDERAFFADQTAYGISRKAILAAGTLLAKSGVIPQAELLLDATHEEMIWLSTTNQGGQSSEVKKLVSELEIRKNWRTTQTTDDAPSNLGSPPLPPPPLDFFPLEFRETLRAIDFSLRGIYGERTKPVTKERITGYGIGTGIAEGPVCLVLTEKDLSLVRKGDIVVTKSTTAAFGIVLPLINGLVTDMGGILSHAAIVAREFGISAVIGTRNSTKLLKNGMRIRVDGNTGEVVILK